jgi:hypothetical protein
MRRRSALPRKEMIGAFILGADLSDGTRTIGFPIVAEAIRDRDGKNATVAVCALRPEPRSLTRPGRYSGTVRAAGPRVASVDVPVEVTIKGARTETLLFAILIALVGAGIGAANSKPADVSKEKTEEKATRHLLLSLLPFGAGIIAGLVAALVVYADNPTFGANRGADTAKLLAAIFAAATGGLTVTAPPARGARKKLAEA